MTEKPSDANAETTAIIDVGSNSVRLVIFGQSERAPLPMLNEKAFCSLGKGVGTTGQLNPDGVEHALDTLKRFRWLAKICGVSRTIAFATAAVRDATDGPEFVRQVKKDTGFELRVLSGAEEAGMAGQGILFGIPAADGVVADMGGSSLELARISDGKVDRCITLPVGPLQFLDGDDDPVHIREVVDAALADQPVARKLQGRPLYLVGGTWRAFAKLDIGMRNYGLNIIHGYQMSTDRARDLANVVSRQSPESLVSAHGISTRRLQALPTSAVVLGRLLHILKPGHLVFSSHGVREGAYFESLPEDIAATDPLIAGVMEMAELETRFDSTIGQRIDEWIAPLFADGNRSDRRLRRAACLLCDVGWRSHPDYRATQSFRRVLRAPLIGIDHAERTFLAICTLRRYSHKAGDAAIQTARTLLTSDQILLAEQTGAAIRLALTLTAGAPEALKEIRLKIGEDAVVLKVPERLSFIVNDAVQSRLKNLASLFLKKPSVQLED